MQTPLKLRLNLLIIALCTLSFVYQAEAAEYPHQTIKIICADQKGSDIDFNTRLLGRYLSSELQTAVEISNYDVFEGRMPMNHFIGTEPDGYTLFTTSSAKLTTNELSGFDKFKQEEFVPVAVFGRQSGDHIVVGGRSHYKTLDDLFARARKTPHKIKFGISIGSVSDFTMLFFEKKKEVYFKTFNVGGAEARINALLNRNIDVTIVPFTSAKPYLDSGKIKSLATLRSNRLPACFDVPTIMESGLPELSVDSIFIIYAPKGTPKEIVDKLNATIVKLSQENKAYQDEYRAYNYQEPYALNQNASAVRIEGEFLQVLKFRRDVAN